MFYSCKILVLFLFFNFCYSCIDCARNSTRGVCTDYPSCKLISDQMFESYCNRSTLKNMCPTHCDKKCKNSTSGQPSVKSLELSSIEEEEFEEDEEFTTTVITTKKPTKTTLKKKTSKTSKPTSTTKPTTTTSQKTEASSEPKTSNEFEVETTTPEPISTSTKLSKGKKISSITTTKSTTIKQTTTDEIEKKINLASSETDDKSASKEVEYEDEDKSEEIEPSTSTITTTTTTTAKTTKAKPKSTKKMAMITSSKKTLLQTEKDNLEPVTKTVPNLPNATIYVPLYEAGFVQRVIPTSNKPECDFTKALVCKKDNCVKNAVWCPMTNDIPKEQLEILFNYTTDIYMFETQGKMDTNETVTNFLFQYLNEAGVLVSYMYRTDTKNSTVINKFMFDPPLRTNYIRITPIDFVQSIAMRFEVYSKGVLYNPNKD